jgi:hypothetical protein
MVVACKSCNSELRDLAGLERDTLNPPPEQPYYSAFTAEWLTKNGRPDRADRGTATRQPAGHRT